ncbi:hypothetical protein QYF36_003120 [Acer negundo]|nr:hypothetical protein QYF36_003120 [Acer negundo]
MAKITGMRKLVIITAMVLFMFMAIVAEAGRFPVDMKCYHKCYDKYCHFTKPVARCVAFCCQKCRLPDPEALDDCTLSCVDSKCNNFSSDLVDELEGCVGSCAENCKKNN